ncbi:hypothetical protein Y1Q_0012061 [Alligator mississippiensis]|uniref:Uncharacterized protein n=1 Tax=Alligator mississippiensis TaxID=8496 RepID=A0A151P5M9_ALLMI|nr:hypothetical protein Y1Q_0012061 [Alligator mississippiensis]
MAAGPSVVGRDCASCLPGPASPGAPSAARVLPPWAQPGQTAEGPQVRQVLPPRASPSRAAERPQDPAGPSMQSPHATLGPATMTWPGWVAERPQGQQDLAGPSTQFLRAAPGPAAMAQRAPLLLLKGSRCSNCHRKLGRKTKTDLQLFTTGIKPEVSADRYPSAVCLLGENFIPVKQALIKQLFKPEGSRQRLLRAGQSLSEIHFVTSLAELPQKCKTYHRVHEDKFMRLTEE